MKTAVASLQPVVEYLGGILAVLAQIIKYLASIGCVYVGEIWA